MTEKGRDRYEMNIPKSLIAKKMLAKLKWPLGLSVAILGGTAVIYALGYVGTTLLLEYTVWSMDQTEVHNTRLTTGMVICMAMFGFSLAFWLWYSESREDAKRELVNNDG